MSYYGYDDATSSQIPTHKSVDAVGLGAVDLEKEEEWNSRIYSFLGPKNYRLGYPV